MSWLRAGTANHPPFQAAWHKQKGKSGRGGERESEGKRGKVQAEEKEGRVRASPSTESGRKRRHHQVFLQVRARATLLLVSGVLC